MPPLVLAAALLEGLALTLIQGFLPLYVRRVLGETSLVTVALVVGVPALGTAVGSNIWGGVSDVTGRLKPVILVGLVGYAIALSSIPAFHGGVVIMVVVAGASLLYGTLAPSLRTYATLVRPTQKETAITFILLSQSVGWLLGSTGGGRLMEDGLSTGMRLALRICAGLFSVFAIIALVWLRDQRRPPAQVSPRHASWAARVAADLRALYENPRLRRLCFLAFFMIAGNYIAWGFFSVYLVEHLGASIRVLRYLLALSSLFGIASFLLVPRLVRRFGAHRTLLAGVILYVVMYIGMGLLRDPILVGILFAIPLYGLVNVSTNVLASEYSAVSQRGGGLGVLYGTYASATLVGPLVGGFLADRAGLGVVPWVACGFLSVATLVAWRFAGRATEPGAVA